MLTGSDGSDVLAGGTGTNDRCRGGPGTDSLAPDHGCETVVAVP